MSDITPTPYSWRDPKTIPTRAEEIRDLNSRIKAQAAEIERLREALRNTERVLSCAIGNMEAHKECDECQQSVGTYHEAVVYARAALGETE